MSTVFLGYNWQRVGFNCNDSSEKHEWDLHDSAEKQERDLHDSPEKHEQHESHELVFLLSVIDGRVSTTLDFISFLPFVKSSRFSWNPIIENN